MCVCVTGKTIPRRRRRRERIQIYHQAFRAFITFWYGVNRFRPFPTSIDVFEDEGCLCVRVYFYEKGARSDTFRSSSSASRVECRSIISRRIRQLAQTLKTPAFQHHRLIWLYQIWVEWPDRRVMNLSRLMCLCYLYQGRSYPTLKKYSRLKVSLLASPRKFRPVSAHRTMIKTMIPILIAAIRRWLDVEKTCSRRCWKPMPSPH